MSFDMPVHRHRSDGWSDHEVATLIAMYNQGASGRRVAEALGRSYGATRIKIGKLREEGYKIEQRRVNHCTKARAATSTHGVAIGQISTHLFAQGSNVTDEAVAWIMRQAAALGCASVAEYLVELALDEYFKEMNGGKDE